MGALLIFAIGWFAVSLLISLGLQAFRNRLSDPRPFAFEKDPYFNRDYARPPRERCRDCNGTGLAGRLKGVFAFADWRCPTCLGRSAPHPEKQPSPSERKGS